VDLLTKFGETESCFTVMPLGDFDEYYNKIHKQAILEVGLVPLRADNIFTGTIIKDI
jgi:hypothetical protein